MLQSKGIRVVEPYSLHGMTATEFRALADQYGLRIVGRHGGVAEGHVGLRDRHRQDPGPWVHRAGRVGGVEDRADDVESV